MDPDEIDMKIEAVGADVFDDCTGKWLRHILTTHHSKLRAASNAPESIETDGAGSSSSSRSSSPDAGESGGKPRSRKSTDTGVTTTGSKKKKKHGSSSLASTSVELIVYTMGNLVSKDSLIIPRHSTVLGFRITYSLKLLPQEEEHELTKSVIVKLIDDDEDWDDFDEEDKENTVLKSTEDKMAHIDGYNPVITEYNFYITVVPEIEFWAASRGVPFKFGIPQCIHGHYIPHSHSRKSPFLLNELSTLVLEDLIENDGYVMKNPGIGGLQLDELKAAVTEIAKIHAASWAYQESIGMSLKEKYKHFFEDLNEEATNFSEDIEESTPEIEAFFKERGGPEDMRLLGKVTNWLPRVKEVVQECFIPTGPDSLVCLVHSNFWHQNLLFKNTTEEKGNGSEDKTAIESQSQPPQSDRKGEITCRILDWENVNVSQPMVDVACLLFRSANPKLRREHLDEFLELYTNTFRNTTQFLGIPTVYDLNYFKQQYRKCAIFPIVLVMSTMALTLCDETAMELFMQGLLDCESDHFN